MKIDTILDDMSEDIDKLSQQAYKKVLKLVDEGVTPQKAINEALSSFNSAYYEAVSVGLSAILKDSVGGEYIKDMSIGNLNLSQTLYNHQKTVQTQAKAVINEHLKTNGTIKELSKKLYEGYNFKEDPLNVKKGLPKYLIKEVDSMSLNMANKLKTPALKASYLQLLNAKSEADYKNKLKVAVYERNRYYADRIAQTETFKAYSEGEARLHMEDTELTTIKIKMSSSHPHEDICDYHAGVNLYGLGAGVYPKEKAPLPPYHPRCRCRMLPKHSLDATNAKYNPNAPSDALNKFPLHIQRRIIGSNEKLMRFNNGEDFHKIIDEMKHRGYKLGFVGDILKSPNR